MGGSLLLRQPLRPEARGRRAPCILTCRAGKSLTQSARLHVMSVKGI
ncbi:hypothetical protein ACS15_4578 [Ralstonia insidiosa]|uniref:Uncharacterized protein n=1 Tax=Ralstonia insidiosa TaxID=190721 RepID=A0AAC9FU69_9RALS|nr:hypothetical protein ACS15_4578 [Ralstonia insidiosa]